MAWGDPPCPPDIHGKWTMRAHPGQPHPRCCRCGRYATEELTAELWRKHIEAEKNFVELFDEYMATEPE